MLACTRDYQTYRVLFELQDDAAGQHLAGAREFYDDEQGQRTGTKTRYVETGIGWQHWFSPQIEIRPEFTYYKSLDAFAFNGNSNLGIAPTRNYALVGAADLILHF